MTQKGVDLRLAAAECDEGFDRGTAAAGGQHLAAEALAVARVACHRRDHFPRIHLGVAEERGPTRSPDPSVISKKRTSGW